MVELLLLLTGMCVLVSMAVAYSRARDPLHPLMFIGPMLLYVYVAKPSALILQGQMQEFLTVRQIEFAQLLFLGGVGGFCLGALVGSRGGRSRIWFVVTPPLRKRMVRLATLLGILSLSAYWLGITLSGGFFTVYSRSKAVYSSGSGWINELVNLSVPSAALMLLAWQGDKRYRHYIGWALVFASPLLIHGLLGSRRGPTFTILAAALVAWYIRRGPRVSLWKVTAAFGLICALALFLVAHRGEIRLGGDVDFSLAKFWERVSPSEVDTTDDTVFMYGFVNGVRETGACNYGRAYFTTYVVRPIPRQLWPTKYEDLGVGWLVNQRDFGGITNEEWEAALGWAPARGSATGFTGDLYLEFGLAGLMGCLALGFMYGRLWLNASRWGGVWTLLFVEAAALAIYVPTQSVSAVLHRFLFMSIPTYLIWRWYIGKGTGAGHGGLSRHGAGQPRFAASAMRPQNMEAVSARRDHIR